MYSMIALRALITKFAGGRVWDMAFNEVHASASKSSTQPDTEYRSALSSWFEAYEADLAEAFAKLEDGARPKAVQLLYFAKLREERKLGEERYDTLASTAGGLYEDLRFQHRLSLKPDSLRVAINGDFASWDSRIHENDEIVFIPPVAGG